MEDNLIEQAKKKKKTVKPAPAPEVYGNYAVKPLGEAQQFRVRAPSAVTGVRG